LGALDDVYYIYTEYLICKL